jgi:hypothetical protein
MEAVMSGRKRNYTTLLVGVIVTVAGLIGFGVLTLSGAVGHGGAAGDIPLIGPAVVVLFGIFAICRWCWLQARRAVRRHLY